MPPDPPPPGDLNRARTAVDIDAVYEALMTIAPPPASLKWS